MTPATKMEPALRPAQRARGCMSFYPLATPSGDDVRLMLGPVGTYSTYIPFEPSVFGGSGGEPRKAVRFAVYEDELLNSILDMERKARALLEGTGPKFTWVSSITEATELYPASVKAKIRVTGGRAALIRDKNGEPIRTPGQPWPRPRANALLEARGVYRMANGTAGLILQVAALQLSEQAFGVAQDLFAN